MEKEINIDKIIEKSKQWTLEGDCTLLQWMNQISNNLEERVTKTSSAINQMSTKLDRTSIALSNVTNNLAALQYSKFVENRVHEDDETLPNTANVPSEDVTDKKNSGQDIYSFLKKNVEMMNSCHESYYICYEDSDDDDEPIASVVYRSKNPYESRPLPHIYGSNQWKKKWHIGLCDSDDDFSGEENSEQFSESSSNADDSYESTAQTISEWDSTAWGLNTQHNNVERKNMHTPSNDGESSYQGEDYNQSKVSTPRTQRHVPIAQQPPIQDQRYYQHVPRRQESLFDDIFDDSKAQEVATPIVPPQVVPRQVDSAPQTKIIPESYIPNEPPPDEQSLESESNRRPGAKKTLNLFDDDEFSSFMDQIVQKATNKNIKPNENPQENPESSKKAAPYNDFNDHVPPDNDSQSQPKKALAPNLFDQSNIQKQKQSTKTLASNIFNEPDDLFSSPTEKTQEPPRKTIAPNLFRDSDDLFAPSIREQPIVKRKSSSSPKLEDDIFTASPKPVAIIGKTKIKNLFDDDDEDDDFDNIFSSKPSASKTFSQATKNIFSDDLDVKPEIKEVSLENDNLIREVPTTSTGLFNDEQNGIVPENEKAAKTPLLKENLAVQKEVFADDDDGRSIVEKEVSSGFPVLKEDNLKEGSLLKKGLFDDFDELDDENDIFSTKPAKKDTFENIFQKDKSDNRLSKIQSKILFGDENEKEDSEIIEPKKSELNEENVKNKPSDSENISNIVSDALTNEPPADIFASSFSSIQKTKVADIFADDVPDDFENFISINPLKSGPVTEEYSKIPESPKKANSTEKIPVTVPNLTEPTVSPVTTPKLPPIIAQKPLVDKTSKPQSKVISKNNIKAGSSKNDTTATKLETEQISPSYSEDPHPDSSKSDASQLSETAKTQIHSVSKLDSTLKINVSESSKDFEAKKVQIEDKQKNFEEENTQTHMVEKGSKPIPKPKPKVIIEDDKTSFPSKDIAVENLQAEQSAKKPSTIPSYTSLFHDDFPPEDENPNPASNEESPLHTVEEDVDVVKPIPTAAASSVPYSSINLFADVPPDDYFSGPSTPPATAASQTKRIHSIFYDDFNETIEAGREMRTPSNYMFNDEPPPDDEKVNKPVISDVVVQKGKPKVSKLKKMDFHINVGALLPSAKLPSFKKPEVIEKSQSEISIKEQTPTSIEKSDFVPSQLASAKTKDLPENILPNLNRDRAKVHVKRRPSTRMGRQERYRKSMIEDTVSMANQEQNEIEITKSMSSSLFEDLQTGRQENQEISKIETKEQMIAAVPSSSFGDFGTFDKKQEIIRESKGDANKMPDQATLFEESDNLFKKHIVVTPNSSSMATTTKIPSLFTNSDSEPENIFETIKTVKSKTKKVELDAPPMNKNLDSLFDSDEIDENPFGTPKNFLPPPSSSSTTPKETATNKLPEDKSKLDLLFESVKQKEPKGQSIKTAFKTSGEPAKKTTPKSLFGDDSDDGSDDLFKGPSVSKKTVSHKKPENKPKMKPLSKPAKQSSASLFSSDEGSASGDDIFGKAKTKTSAKKNESIKDKASSNLFADLSDDDSDGLFGTSTKKPIGVNKSKTNPPKARVQSTKQPAQAQQAKAISSNPLSDLLGP